MSKIYEPQSNKRKSYLDYRFTYKPYAEFYRQLLKAKRKQDKLELRGECLPHYNVEEIEAKLESIWQ